MVGVSGLKPGTGRVVARIPFVCSHCGYRTGDRQDFEAHLIEELEWLKTELDRMERTT